MAAQNAVSKPPHLILPWHQRSHGKMLFVWFRSLRINHCRYNNVPPTWFFRFLRPIYLSTPKFDGGGYVTQIRSSTPYSYASRLRWSHIHAMGVSNNRPLLRSIIVKKGIISNLELSVESGTLLRYSYQNKEQWEILNEHHYGVREKRVMLSSLDNRSSQTSNITPDLLRRWPYMDPLTTFYNVNSREGPVSGSYAYAKSRTVSYKGHRPERLQMRFWSYCRW